MGIEKLAGSVMGAVSQSTAKSQKIGKLVNVLNAVKEQKAADVFLKSQHGASAVLGVKPPSSWKDIKMFNPHR